MCFEVHSSRKTKEVVYATEELYSSATINKLNLTGIDFAEIANVTEARLSLLYATEVFNPN